MGRSERRASHEPPTAVTATATGYGAASRSISSRVDQAVDESRMIRRRPRRAGRRRASVARATIRKCSRPEPEQHGAPHALAGQHPAQLTRSEHRRHRHAVAVQRHGHTRRVGVSTGRRRSLAGRDSCRDVERLGSPSAWVAERRPDLPLVESGVHGRHEVGVHPARPRKAPTAAMITASSATATTALMRRRIGSLTALAPASSPPRGRAADERPSDWLPPACAADTRRRR